MIYNVYTHRRKSRSGVRLLLGIVNSNSIEQAWLEAYETFGDDGESMLLVADARDDNAATAVFPRIKNYNLPLSARSLDPTPERLRPDEGLLRGSGPGGNG